MAIPYLCPELPAAQKQGLAYGVKVPLVYTKDFYKQVELDYPVSLGAYRRSQTPDEPMILHMCHVYHDNEHKGPELWREGRGHLLATPSSTFEHHVKDQ